jgi:hypothetical protein
VVASQTGLAVNIIIIVSTKTGYWIKKPVVVVAGFKGVTRAHRHREKEDDTRTL